MSLPEKNVFIHSKAIVETLDIGVNTRIWAFVHILPGVSIGENCNICDFCFIETGVKIGHSVTIKCGVYLWTGIELGDQVFVGPNVVFTNDIRPRSKAYDTPIQTVVRKGASLGANSTILAGVEIGSFAMTGIGSVVTRNVPDHALVYGNPARVQGWVDEKGKSLRTVGKGEWESPSGGRFRETSNGLIIES